MAKRRVVFFGNCQAQALSNLCRRFLAPRRDDSISAIIAPVKDLEYARREMASADIVVEQVFDHTLEIDPLAEKLGRKVVRFPNVYAIFYWPYTNQRHPRNDEIGTAYDAGPYPNEMGDSFLNRLIARGGVSPDDALELYLREDMSSRADRLFEINAEMQRKRDAATGFDIEGEIQRHFRDDHLFLTSAHPNMRIFSAVAEGILPQLGYARGQVRAALAAQRVSPFPHHALPIHPRIINHFGLTFATTDTRYPFFEEGEFTFAEYVRRYMTFEWNQQLRDALPMAVSDPDRALRELNAALQRSPRSATAKRVISDLLLRKHDHAGALAAATEATELEPTDPRNWLALSRVHRTARDFDPAGRTLDRAAAIAPVNAEITSEAAHLAASKEAWADAAEAAQRAVDIEPGAARLYLQLSDLLAHSGQLEPAVAAARRAVELEPDAAGSRLALADRLDRAGEGDEAVAIMQAVLAEGGRDPHAYARLGHLLARRNDFDGGAAALRRAVELAPNDPGLRIGLADILDRKGATAEAVDIARGLVAADSRDPHVHARLGHFLDRSGDSRGAEAAFRRAVELAPGVPHYAASLSDMLERDGRAAEAVAVLQAIAEGSGDPHLHRRLSHLLFHSGDLDAAEVALRRAIGLAPGERGFRRALVGLLDRRDRADEALAVVEELAEAGDRDKDTLGWLGHLRMKAGNLDGAEAAFRLAIDIAPDEARFRLALADTLDRKGRAPEALAAISKLVADGVRDRHTYGRLGHLSIRTGDLDGAESAFRQAIDIAPEETGFRLALADTLDRQGKHEEALAIVRKMVDDGVRDRHVYRRLGDLLSRTGDIAAANEAFRRANGVEA